MQQLCTSQKTDTMATDEIQETSLQDEKGEPVVSVGLQKSEDSLYMLTVDFSYFCSKTYCGCPLELSH